MELKSILEAILFSAEKPLTPAELRELLRATVGDGENKEIKALKKTKVAKIEEALEGLGAEINQLERSFRLICVAGAWQFVSAPEFAPWIRALVGQKPRPTRLSQPALETLAIIAYRQPITRAEVEQIRGVSIDGVLHTLLERELVEQVGRAEVVGRPMMYGTAPRFLEYFGLKDLEDLPAADELRRIEVEKPESLLTIDPGLATTPPEELASGDDEVSKSASEASDSPEEAPGETGAAAPTQDKEAIETESDEVTEEPRTT